MRCPLPGDREPCANEQGPRLVARWGRGPAHSWLLRWRLPRKSLRSAEGLLPGPTDRCRRPRGSSFRSQKSGSHCAPHRRAAVCRSTAASEAHARVRVSRSIDSPKRQIEDQPHACLMNCPGLLHSISLPASESLKSREAASTRQPAGRTREGQADTSSSTPVSLALAPPFRPPDAKTARETVMSPTHGSSAT